MGFQDIYIKEGVHMALKRKIGIFLLLASAAALCVFGGLKLGRYFAYWSKGAEIRSSSLSGVKAGGKYGTNTIITEGEKVQITSTVSEFINAEHRKRNDMLTDMVAHDYYSRLLDEIKRMSSGPVSIREMNFTEVESGRVIVEVKFRKYSASKVERITLAKEDGIWKVNDVKR